MTGGIRAEVTIDDPGACPVSRFTAATSSTSHSISKSVDPADPARVTQEFVADTDVDAASVDLDVDLSEVFSYGESTVYRFARELAVACPCDWVEHFDCPVVDRAATEGRVRLAFHAPDIETLQAVLRALASEFEGFEVRRLLQSQAAYGDHDVAFFDLAELTARQRTVLTTAYRMGYFDHPRAVNAGEVAAELDIATSTFTQHVLAAQRKILAALVTE